MSDKVKYPSRYNTPKNPRELIVSNLRGFFLCPIITKLGELGIINKMLEGPFAADSFNEVYNKKNFQYVLNYLDSLAIIEKIDDVKYQLTKTGKSVLRRWGSFAILYSYHELVENMDSLLTVPDYPFPACDRRYNVIGSGLTNGRKFFPAGIKNLENCNVSSITDLCCGDGEFLLQFSEQHPSAKLNAVDLSSIAIQETRKKLNSYSKVATFTETNALNVADWAPNIPFSDSGHPVISMWYLIHEVSSNDPDKVIKFLKEIHTYAPTAHLLIGEIIRIDISTLKTTSDSSIIPEFILFHDFSGQGVLTIEQINYVFSNIPYTVKSLTEFDMVKTSENTEQPSALVVYLEPCN